MVHRRLDIRCRHMASSLVASDPHLHSRHFRRQSCCCLLFHPIVVGDEGCQPRLGDGSAKTSRIAFDRNVAQNRRVSGLDCRTNRVCEDTSALHKVGYRDNKTKMRATSPIKVNRCCIRD